MAINRSKAKEEEKNYEIVEEIGVLSTDRGGWTKELNKVSWYGGETKWDIRDWSPDKEKSSKGITLSDDEILALKKVLERLEEED